MNRERHDEYAATVSWVFWSRSWSAERLRLIDIKIIKIYVAELAQGGGNCFGPAAAVDVFKKSFKMLKIQSLKSNVTKPRKRVLKIQPSSSWGFGQRLLQISQTESLSRPNPLVLFLSILPWLLAKAVIRYLLWFHYHGQTWRNLSGQFQMLERKRIPQPWSTAAPENLPEIHGIPNDMASSVLFSVDVSNKAYFEIVAFDCGP
jgi:hypothetical protein